MEENELLELIDEYLLGRIKAEDLARLEYLRMTNPEIDLQVNQSIEAFRVLQYARYKQLRLKLHQIDASDTKAVSGYRYRQWVIAAVLFIISLLGAWMWAMEHCSPVSLATRHFEYVSAVTLLHSDVSDEKYLNWESACRAFNDGDFQSAITLFQPFLENPENLVATYARWNILLARFALEGPGLSWREEIRQFESVAPEPFKAKVAALLHIIDSPFYQVVVLRLSPPLSVLKPRLM